MMNTHLSIFEEYKGYGINHSYDGGFYPYRVDPQDSTQIIHLKDERGLDLRCTSRDEAIEALREMLVPPRANQQANDEQLSIQCLTGGSYTPADFSCEQYNIIEK